MVRVMPLVERCRCLSSSIRALAMTAISTASPSSVLAGQLASTTASMTGLKAQRFVGGRIAYSMSTKPMREAISEGLNASILG